MAPLGGEDDERAIRVVIPWVGRLILAKSLGTGRERVRVRSYGKQPRQRQRKKTRLAPQEDRAPRARQEEHQQEGEKVASFYESEKPIEPKEVERRKCGELLAPEFSRWEANLSALIREAVMAIAGQE